MVDTDFIKDLIRKLESLEDSKGIIQEEVKSEYDIAKSKGVKIDIVKRIIRDRMKGKDSLEAERDFDVYRAYSSALD